jgi:hypothetical protein
MAQDADLLMRSALKHGRYRCATFRLPGPVGPASCFSSESKARATVWPCLVRTCCDAAIFVIDRFIVRQDE